jgi:hypothetical protein
MSVNFEIVGKLVACKETDSFKPLEVRDFDSGWQNTRYRFNVVSGKNRFMCEVGGGKWTGKKEKDNKIMTYSRATADKKSERIEIEWGKRRDPDSIARVAGYRIFTCNLLDFDEQAKLKENGEEDVIKKKNHQYLEGTEYATFIKKVIDSGKHVNSKFKICGTMDFQYSEKDNMYYRKLSVNKIYKVTDDTPFKSEMTINTYYTETSLDTDMYDDTKKYFFNCYTDYYFNKDVKTKFVPITLVINGNGDEKAEKKAEAFRKKLTSFDDEATVRKINLVCDMIDGAEEQAITYDDLDDETKENIDADLITLEDAIKSLGGTMFGNRITEYRLKSLARTSAKGSEVTVLTEDKLRELPIISVSDTTVNVEVTDDDNIFDDDDI